MLHLRYPNAHTHWFSALVLHLFIEVNDDKFREVMTKVLLERFIVHRPHPWGALTTFIELLRNPKYEFWNKDFIRIAPEVSLLLESVSTLGFSVTDSMLMLLSILAGCNIDFPTVDFVPFLVHLLSLHTISCFHTWVLFLLYSPRAKLYCNSIIIFCLRRFKC